MKNNNFLKIASTLVLCGFFMFASAADIYLASSGADTNDGMSPGTPVKTLSKALTICLAGDVINVMDMINIKDEPKTSGARGDVDVAGTNTAKVIQQNGVTYSTWNTVNGTMGIIPHSRSITIQGADKSSCGFDGNDVSCIIRHDHGTTGTAAITYKNLTFRNGKTKDNSGGGAVYVRLSNITETGQAAIFENCDFIANKANNDKPGGAVCVIQIPSLVHFTNCRFAENVASKGAALYFERGNVTIDHCIFENHDLSVENLPHLTSAAAALSVGAAIHTNIAAVPNMEANLTVRNTVFRNNKAGRDGGAFSTSETNAVQTGATNAKFYNCAFIDNTAVLGTGGAVYMNTIMTGATQDVMFVNSTFKGNHSGAAFGGAIATNNMFTGSKLGLINCTVSGNTVAGTNGAAGAGIYFMKTSVAGIRSIKNCIVENNTAVDANMASAADYADLGMENVVNAETQETSPSYVAGTSLIVEKSLIGTCTNADFTTQFPNNKTNYVFELNGSIKNSYKAKLGEFDEEDNYFPLLAGSEAIGYGDVTFLTSLTPSITTDQIGRIRPAANISAGAYEFATVSGLNTVLNEKFSVIRNANNQLVVELLSGNSGIVKVMNMMGQVVANQVINSAVTTIQQPVASGVYVVVLSIDGQVGTRKVMLN
ncbi:MAG: T9SS type A sorting domain-containing protein [Paludibacter sp.]|nr:T9SS type A sorting domain-containing protein [Paludibacter sp.]